MPSDPVLAGAHWQRRTEPDDLPEWMDEPCSYEDLRACLRDLGQVNKLTFGYKPTIAFFERLAARKSPPAKLRVLDVGFGGGDALHRLALWSRKHGVGMQLSGIDLNPHAARAARERQGDVDVQWLIGDALAYTGEVDVVISSLLTHHLSTEQVVAFVSWMESKASVGWFINDLERSARSASVFGTLARVMRWHRFVQHDGPVSFARAFTPEDWQHMLARSGVPPGSAEIARGFPARLCVSRFK